MRIQDDNKQDERIAEQRETARKEQQRKQTQKPAETFEAKLSEKNAHDHAMLESDARRQLLLKETKKEKTSLIDKLIKETKPKSVDERRQSEAALLKSKALKKNFEDEKKTELQEHEELPQTDDAEETTVVERSEDQAGVDESDDSSSADKTKESGKEGDVAEDGHKRVAEKREGNTSGGGSGGGGQSMDGNSGGAGEFGSGSSQGDGKKDGKAGFQNDIDRRSTSLAGSLSGRFSGGGFQQNSRAFNKENLDALVAKVQIGINAQNEEVFAVDLHDSYFDGLKLSAVKTAQGVVLRFECPNLAVRSTFIRERTKIYERLKAKNISVFRIDVI